MWQAYVYPMLEGALLTGVMEPIEGKVRHSKKEARFEARRLARAFIVEHNLFVSARTLADIDRMPANCIIPITERGYGVTYANVGVRWQPEE